MVVLYGILGYGAVFCMVLCDIVLCGRVFYGRVFCVIAL